MSSSTLPHPTTRKQAQSEGGGAPQWLVDLGVGPGEFYQTSKAQPRSIMRNPSWSEKARVWCCLSLHTMAFQCEEATKLVKGQRVPLTRGDIAAECGLTPAQVRRSLVSLEQEGYAERRGGDGGLRKGEITIHCWAIPRPAKSEPVQDEKLDRLEIPEDLPAYLQKWIRKFRLERLPEPEVLAQAGRLAEAMEKSETELRQLLKPADSETQPRTPKKTVRGTNLAPFGVPVCLPHIRMKDSGKIKPCTAAATGPQVLPKGSAAAAVSDSFPLTKQAVREHDAGVNRGFLDRLVSETLQAACSNEIDASRVTDQAIARAIEESYRTGPRRHGTGLLLNRVPEIICAWATMEA